MSIPIVQIEEMRAIVRKGDVASSSSDLFEPLRFDIEVGSMTLLTGDNGAGKTTILRGLVGLEAGLEICARVKSGGRPITLEMLRQEVRFWFAEAGHMSWPDLTVEENLELVQLAQVGRINQKVIGRTMSEWGVSDLAKRKVGTLSGGERVRLEVGMADVSGARIVLLDEPVSGLDRDSILAFEKNMTRLLDCGVALVIAEHLTASIESLRGLKFVKEVRVKRIADKEKGGLK